MTNIIGQKHLLSKLDSFNLTNMPHSIILCGDVGSGRHTVCKYIASKFNIGYIDSTMYSSVKEVVEEQISSPLTNLYVFDADELSIPDQNALLKFIEEPLNNTYIVIISSSNSMLLDTIVGRCIRFNMDEYSVEELNNFTDNPSICEVFNTPGKIEFVKKYDVDSMFKFCDSLIGNLHKACMANVLTISNRFSYKEGEDLFYVPYFIDMMCYRLNDMFYSTKNKIVYDMYMLTRDLKNKLKIPCDKRRAFEAYLVDMKLLTMKYEN